MRKVIVILFASLTSISAFADATIDRLQNLAQPQFRLLSEDLGAILSYKPLSPGETLGVTGFDLGFEVTGTSFNNKDVIDAATSGNAPSLLPVPKLHAHKGLPAGFDIGVTYASVPSSNIRLFGGEIRYALIEGGIATPALALRGSYTKLTGVDQLGFDTKGVDISISKGFAIAKPYAGIGRVWVSSTPNLPAIPTNQGNVVLTGEKFALSKVFVGVNLNFGLTNLAFEADRTGDATSFGAKIGWRF
ncbi:MAG: hypothetical protein WCD07_00640 [Burkholderiales bacterium]